MCCTILNQADCCPLLAAVGLTEMIAHRREDPWITTQTMEEEWEQQVK